MQEDEEEEAKRGLRASLRRSLRRSFGDEDERFPPPNGHVQALQRHGTAVSIISHATAETGGSYGATTLGETGTQASNDSDQLLGASQPRGSISEDAEKGVNVALLLYSNEKYGPTVVKMWKPMFRSKKFALKGLSLRKEQEAGFLNPLRKVFVIIFLISERRSTFQRALLRDPKFHAFVKRAHEVEGMCMLAVKLPVSGNVKKLKPQKLRLPEHFPPYKTWIPFHRRGAEQQDMKTEIWARIEKRGNFARKRLLRVKSLLGLPGPLERNDLDEMTAGTREWLVQDFERWKTSDDRVFVLMAYAGMGKSAFMNTLVKKHKVDVAAEIRVKGRVATDSSAKYLVQFIANQMGQSVQAFPKRKRGGMQDQLEADREEAQLQEESVAQSFERLVCKRARALPPQPTKIVFIDGIDHCQPADERDDLIDVLAKWTEKTPSWLKLFVASSPAFGVPEKLGHHTCVTIDMDDERNIEDLRIYANSVLRKLNINVEKSVSKVLEESCGWFKYAKYLLDELTEQAQVQDGDTDVLNVLTTLTPHILLPRVRRDYKSHFTALARFFKSQKLEYRNILAPIAAARVRVPLQAWRELTQMTVNLDQYLRRYLVIERGHIRLLHHSMRTWMESIEQGELKINIAEGHQMLAAWCFQIEKALQNSRNRVTAAIDDGEVNPNEQEVEEVPRESRSKREEQDPEGLEGEAEQGGEASEEGIARRRSESKPIEEEELMLESVQEMKQKSRTESFGSSLETKEMVDDDEAVIMLVGEIQEGERGAAKLKEEHEREMREGGGSVQQEANPMETEVEEHEEAVEIMRDRDKLSQRFAHGKKC